MSSSEDGCGATALDRRLAPVMFQVTTLYIVTLGIALHVMRGDAEELYGESLFRCGVVLGALPLIYLLEVCLHARAGAARWRRDLLVCLFPPARLAARDHGDGGSVWLPRLGWRRADDDLAKEVEQRLGIPMICVALLVLPLLGLEYKLSEKGEEAVGWDLGMRLASAFIWTLFTMEFIVMVRIVGKKLQYVKQHWLDLAIILLPVVEFLRALRIGRLLRLHQLTKLGRTARVFRMRGLMMRSWRAILLLGVIQRVLRQTPEKRMAALRQSIGEQEERLAELRAELAELERKMSDEDEARVVTFAQPGNDAAEGPMSVVLPQVMRNAA
jgi:hypothetical protein